MSGRHDNHNSHSSPQQHEFQDVRHHKGGHPLHHSSSGSHPPSLPENNGRFYSNGHEDVRYSERRTHHMQSHDNHMTSSNSRHHPYQRHSGTNGWRWSFIFFTYYLQKINALHCEDTHLWHTFLLIKKSIWNVHPHDICSSCSYIIIPLIIVLQLK